MRVRARSPGPALIGDGLTVEHGMFCSRNFVARGEVDWPVPASVGNSTSPEPLSATLMG